MYKATIALMLAGAALVPFADFRDAPVINWRGADEKIFLIRNASGDSCKLLTVPEGQKGMWQASPQAGCSDIDEKLDAIRMWRETSDGRIELDDAQGRALIALKREAGDGYTSLNPPNLILTVTPE